LLALALLVLSGAQQAHAQAWVPDKGDGTISLSTRFTRVSRHLFTAELDGVVDPVTGYRLGPGHAGYFGDLTSLSQTLGAEHVPLKRLAVTAEVFLFASRYTGRSPESRLDDGSYHLDLQDLMLGARYQLPVRALALTPSLDVRFPLTDYNTLGHVGAGTGLASLTVGLNAGRSLSPVLPLGYAFVNVARQIIENVGDYSMDRDLVTIGGGVFLSRALSAQVHFGYEASVDGVDWWAEPGHAQHRTVAGREIVRRIGGSVGYSLGYRVGAALSAETTVSGANVHATQSVTLGLSWSYWDPKRIARMFGTSSVPKR